MFKINYHAHTRYSDGSDTLEEMVLAAKELGLCCFVATDHYYGSHCVDPRISLTKERWLREVREAKELEQKLQFPIFIGVEAGFARAEEVNVFGFDAISFLFDAEKNDYETFKHMRENYECACILNHPNLVEKFLNNNGPEIIDGFEHFNHGQNFFPSDRSSPHFRPIPDYLKGKKFFSNSDAHSKESLPFGYNYTDIAVKTEEQLIESIRKGPEKVAYRSPVRDGAMVVLDCADISTYCG